MDVNTPTATFDPNGYPLVPGANGADAFSAQLLRALLSLRDGDFAVRLPSDVKGEILELKNTINTMVDQLNAFACRTCRTEHTSRRRRSRIDGSRRRRDRKLCNDLRRRQHYRRAKMKNL